MKTAYGERDSAYGAAMLRLRTALGFTQAELAKQLGISRRTVGEWEAGNSYSKVEHLKELIALGVKSQAFTAGSEAEEIRALWKVAHQKVLLDECWLSALLAHPCSAQLHPVPPPIEENIIQASSEPVPTSGGLRVPVAGLRVDWGDALAVPVFYGREEELAQLSQWMVQDGCDTPLGINTSGF